MSNQTLNQDLLDDIRTLAKSKTLEDKSKCYQQWLTHFSRQYGHTWESLISRVAELEKAALAERLAADEARWVTRLSERVWGEIPHPDEQTLPLPIQGSDSTVAWPNCFIGSNIFSPTDVAPHELISGPVFSGDDDTIEFYGEQLWNGVDQIAFMTLIVMSRELPTGAILDFTWSDLERVTGKPLCALGTLVDQESFQKALWRLTHGILVFERYGFKGPLLKFADVSKSPKRFRIAFNPDFAKFYYAPRQGLESVEIKTGDGQRLPWSEKLTTYLANRAIPWVPFRLGEWLGTLAVDDLIALQNCLSTEAEGKATHAEADDILNVALTATAIETRKQTVEVSVERIGEVLDVFRLVATFEELKRQGLIELPRALGISSQEEVSFRITEAGMAAGLQMHESVG